MNWGADLFPILLAMAASGVLAGFLAGLMGIGGGIVTVPVLYFAFGMLGVPEFYHMHITVATSLAIIIPTAVFSARAHSRHGAIDWSGVRGLGPGIIIGATVGGLLAPYVKNDALVMFFAILAFVMGLKLLLPLEGKVIGDKIPSGTRGFGFGSFIGGASSLMGIGGATFSVPLMTLYGTAIRTAVGTASFLGLLIAIPAVISFIYAGWNIEGLPAYQLGFVNLIGVLVIAPLSTAMAPVGAALAHRIPMRLLSIIFGAFLILTAGRMGLPQYFPF